MSSEATHADPPRAEAPRTPATDPAPPKPADAPKKQPAPNFGRKAVLADMTPAPTGETVIRVDDVSKCYHIYDKPHHRLLQSFARLHGKRFHRDFWALKGVSFEVRRGEAVGVIGRNGSGKSTLMQLIAGVLRPTGGRIETRGRIGALLTLGGGFNPEFTGRDNVFLYGSILGLTRKQVQERFDEIASFADIGRFIDQPIKTYSSGMRVRLAFSVQVQLDPDILIIDEALAVGDNLFQKRCHQRLKELREKGVTLLFVSHQQEAIRTLTTRAILLHEGKVRASGDPGEVVLDYRRLLHDEERKWYDTRAEAYRQSAEKAASRKPQPELTVHTPEGTESVAPNGTPADDDAKSFGDRDAEVLKVEVLDDARDPCGYFSPGQTVLVRVAVRVNKPMQHLNVALRLRNKEGVKVCSWGTLNQDISLWSQRPEAPADQPVLWDRSFDAGETFAVEFSFECRLGHGFYEVQAMVAEEKDRYYGDERMLHWLDEAAFFHVKVIKDEYFFGGVCDLQMQARVES
ncbi:MAG: ABC transporter ATP-binding protein [Phycisphaerales bacterium JB037]